MKTCCWLGTKLQNQPLLMAGSLEIEYMPILRIMLDCCSAINIIPLKMLLKLRYTINDPSPTNVMTQAFNQSVNKPSTPTDYS